jgi:hypothetical protein
VTVRAHEIALRELTKNLLATPAPEITEVAKLLETWSVIPLHHLRWEDAVTVRAGLTYLEARQPRAETALNSPLRMTLYDASHGPLISRVIDLRAATLADRLNAITAPRGLMELVQRLCFTTSGAALHGIR